MLCNSVEPAASAESSCIKTLFDASKSKIPSSSKITTEPPPQTQRFMAVNWQKTVQLSSAPSSVPHCLPHSDLNLQSTETSPNALRKHEFVKALVGTTAEIINNLYYTAPAAVISLDMFIAEILRRSKSSFSTFQLALFYLLKFRAANARQVHELKLAKSSPITSHTLCDNLPSPPNCDAASISNIPIPASQALSTCGRRLFLTALIMASKYLQDKNYSNKAWSRISGLSAQEINNHERDFLRTLDYGLFLSAAKFARWSTLLVSHINKVHTMNLTQTCSQISHDVILSFDFLSKPKSQDMPLHCLWSCRSSASASQSNISSMYQKCNSSLIDTNQQPSNSFPILSQEPSIPMHSTVQTTHVQCTTTCITSQNILHHSSHRPQSSFVQSYSMIDDQMSKSLAIRPIVNNTRLPNTFQDTTHALQLSNLASPELGTILPTTCVHLPSKTMHQNAFTGSVTGIVNMDDPSEEYSSASSQPIHAFTSNLEHQTKCVSLVSSIAAGLPNSVVPLPLDPISAHTTSAMMPPGGVHFGDPPHVLGQKTDQLHSSIDTSIQPMHASNPPLHLTDQAPDFSRFFQTRFASTSSHLPSDIFNHHFSRSRNTRKAWSSSVLPTPKLLTSAFARMPLEGLHINKSCAQMPGLSTASNACTLPLQALPLCALPKSKRRLSNCSDEMRGKRAIAIRTPTGFSSCGTNSAGMSLPPPPSASIAFLTNPVDSATPNILNISPLQ